MRNTIWSGSNYDDYLYSGPQGRVMDYLHRRMEKPFNEESFFPLTVEVGAGEGQHLPYVRHHFDRYSMVDVRPPPSNVETANCDFIQADVHDLPFERNSIGRLVSTCVLHHLSSPEEALENWREAVQPDGALTLLVATDPGLAHRLGRHLTTRPAAIKLGIDYDLEMAREHRNHALSHAHHPERLLK